MEPEANNAPIEPPESLVELTYAGKTYPLETLSNPQLLDIAECCAYAIHAGEPLSLVFGVAALTAVAIQYPDLTQEEIVGDSEALLIYQGLHPELNAMLYEIKLLAEQADTKTASEVTNVND